MNFDELREFLELKYRQFNNTRFIENDPIYVPHLFSGKEDIEIAGFLSATIAWGQRKSIIANGRKLMRLMEDAPHDFLMNAGAKDMDRFNDFVHRTFNGRDCRFFMESLKNIYQNKGGLEKVFDFPKNGSAQEGIINFRKDFLETPHLPRSEKHIANSAKGASAKRLNMFLRWMVRKDGSGVDFGIWKEHEPAKLFCPLDVHTASVARKLRLLERKQNDWKAVEELTANLRKFDQDDPVKYDFALFGLGAFEKF